MTMTRLEALAALELTEGATHAAVERAYEAHYNELRNSIDNAVTPALKARFQERLARVEEAHAVLRASADYTNLPASGPIASPSASGTTERPSARSATTTLLLRTTERCRVQVDFDREFALDAERPERVAVDPGTHVVQATNAAGLAWETEVRVAANEQAVVTIAFASDARREPERAAPPAQVASSTAPRPWLFRVGVGTGVVVLLLLAWQVIRSTRGAQGKAAEARIAADAQMPGDDWTPTPESVDTTADIAYASAAKEFAASRYGSALEPMRSAAQLGHPAAQYYLGMMYARGHGIARDPSEAARWLQRSAAQGYLNAMAVVGIGYSHAAFGLPDSVGQGLLWLHRAASRRSRAAQFSLGELHEQGRGVAVDTAEAMRWYGLAAAQGSEEAQAAMRRLGGQQ